MGGFYMNSAGLSPFLYKYDKEQSGKGNVFLFFPLPFPHFLLPRSCPVEGEKGLTNNEKSKRIFFYVWRYRLSHHGGKPGGSFWKEDEYHRAEGNRDDHDTAAHVDLLEVDFRCCNDDNRDDGHRWENEPHADHHRQDTVPDRVKPHGSDQWVRQLKNEKHERDLIHEHADNKVDDDDAKNNHVAAEMHYADNLNNMLGDSAQSHVIAKDIGANQYHEDHSRSTYGRFQSL